MNWFAVSEEGSAERRPTNNGCDPELVGRDSVEPEEAPILSFNQRSLPKIITLCHPDPEFLRGVRDPPSRIDAQRSLCVRSQVGEVPRSEPDWHVRSG